MSAVDNQQVTIRRLNDAELHRAVVESLNGRLMRVGLVPNSTDLKLGAGDLVEIHSPHTLYLGEIAACQGEALAINVEHAVDREALSLIQQMWHGPADD